LSTVLHSLNAALRQALENDPAVILLGEDLLDPYGGAFKVTRGLSSAFPGRVMSTPISEAGIVGLATGMALRGLRPVVEIMFGDFVTLIADQVINHAAKFAWMYNGQVQVPLVIRTPMGGRRGYGPTHSQSLEKLFLGTPGLRVLAPCSLGDPGKLLLEAIRDPGPVLFVENKLLYASQLRTDSTVGDFELRLLEGASADPSEDGWAPCYALTIRGAPQPVLTLAAYGYMLELAMEAAYQLAFEHEIFCELVVPTQLSPFMLEPVWSSAQRTGRLMAIEEGSLSLGWGAEVLAQTAQALGTQLIAARRVAAADLPIPASLTLERRVLPGVESIIYTALEIIHGR
jgi:acetoin:2,6-dichlorophenolindophenol oxidoreductase subunit beta